MEIEPIIYGGLNVSENVKEFLKVPPRLRTFGEVNAIDIEVEGEALAAKQRWGSREVNKFPGITTEGLRTRRDLDFDKRQVVNDRRISFAKQRPTDLNLTKAWNFLIQWQRIKKL